MGNQTVGHRNLEQLGLPCVWTVGCTAAACWYDVRPFLLSQEGPVMTILVSRDASYWSSQMYICWTAPDLSAWQLSNALRVECRQALGTGGVEVTLSARP